MKLCPKCSAEVEDGDVKCPACGHWMLNPGPVGYAHRSSGRARGRWRKKMGLLVLLLLAAWALAARWQGVPSPLSVFGGLLTALGLEDGFAPGASLGEQMRFTLEDLTALENVYFQENGEFSGNPLALGFKPPESIRVTIAASSAGWSATATAREPSSGREPSSREGCAVYQGSITPPRVPLEPSGPGKVECNF